MIQSELFSPAGILGSIDIPPAPELNVARFEAYPFPGLTAKETAQSFLSMSKDFIAVVAAVIKKKGGAPMTDKQVEAAIPDDWKEALGRWLHGSLSPSQGEQHGIEVKYVTHDGKGYHFEFRAVGIESMRVVH